MRTATTVTMPKRIVPQFPDRCVVCESETDRTSKIIANSVNVFAILLMPILFFLGWRQFQFPLCRSCRPRFYFQRWGRSLICWAILICTVAIAMPHFENWQPIIRRFAVVGIVVLTGIPYVLFEVFVPRSFDVTASTSKTEFAFRSRSLGIKFYAKTLDGNPNSNITLEIG